MVKLQQTPDGQYLITLPRNYVKKKNWKKGQELLISFDQNGDIKLVEGD